MKKAISLSLIILIMAAALVGCSGATSQPAAAPAPEAAKVEQASTEAPKEEPKKEEKQVEEAVTYKDGVYEGVGQGMHEIKVSVEVVGGKIAKVEVKEHTETAGIAEPALEQTPAAIVEKNSPNVETVAGATIASEGIINAVKNALESAK